MKKCLFLDRDGVINTDIGYAFKPEHMEFVPGIFDICRHWQKLGFLLIIVTNQSGIARGFYSETEFAALNIWLLHAFAEQGIIITAIYHCPHHPDITGPCNCRKPAPGMLLEAIKKYRIDPQFSMMIGDKSSDMKAALAAGIKTRILLHTDKENGSTAATHEIQQLHDIFSLDLSATQITG